MPTISQLVRNGREKIFNRTKSPALKMCPQKQKKSICRSIFTNPTSNRGIISNIYKELKKLNSRQSNDPIKKWNTELNKEFSTEET